MARRGWEALGEGQGIAKPCPVAQWWAGNGSKALPVAQGRSGGLQEGLPTPPGPLGGPPNAFWPTGRASQHLPPLQEGLLIQLGQPCSLQQRLLTDGQAGIGSPFRRAEKG